MGAFYRADEVGLTLTLRVSPKASRSVIIGVMQTADGQALKVAVTAPPDKGRANESVIALLSKAFSIAKRDVTLISGATDRRKVIRLQGDPKALADIAKNWSSP